ncbi:hypothetical protein [Citromicrobium sp. JLT1363]|uniref:hypothetical protein n=1 Tax=Citromicrobium sp. JLT1363 TaxID=517722 RepID=UPI000225EB62|nr:hypothetical protein [Citromicrobium sp. JLT1363]
MRPRILFIGIDFYAYVREIRAAFERIGYDSDFHPIESTDFWSKTAKKFAPGPYQKRLDAYHARLIEQSAATRYDMVLFIQVHHMSHANMARLREVQPQARFVLYNWDSLTTHDYRPYAPFFDSIFTFDPDDARTADVTYLPLFAIPPFYKVDRSRPKDLDLYFVGAIGSLARFEALEKLHAFCEKEGLRTHFHLKCSPAVKLMLKRKGKSLPGITGESMPFEGIIDLIERSRGTFDFANHAQSGYTMRLIENMAAGVKVVTEKTRIETEDFYRDDRFLTIRDHDLSAVPEFLAKPITSQLDVEQFSVDNWVRQLVQPQETGA